MVKREVIEEQKWNNAQLDSLRIDRLATKISELLGESLTVDTEKDSTDILQIAISSLHVLVLEVITKRSRGNTKVEDAWKKQKDDGLYKKVIKLVKDTGNQLKEKKYDQEDNRKIAYEIFHQCLFLKQHALKLGLEWEEREFDDDFFEIG